EPSLAHSATCTLVQSSGWDAVRATARRARVNHRWLLIRTDHNHETRAGERADRTIELLRRRRESSLVAGYLSRPRRARGWWYAGGRVNGRGGGGGEWRASHAARASEPVGAASSLCPHASASRAAFGSPTARSATRFAHVVAAGASSDHWVPTMPAASRA